MSNPSEKIEPTGLFQIPASMAAGMIEPAIKFGQVMDPEEYIQSLPEPMKKRIKALKKLQLEFLGHDADFYNEVHGLEVKYDKQHQKLYQERKLILNGEHEPTDEECQYDEPEKSEELSKELADKVKVEDSTEPKPTHKFDDSTKGIPDFWLTIFRNVDLLAEMLQTKDEPILSHLQDIQLKLLSDPMGFTLEFHFEANEYFTNTVLTKTYEMKCSPSEDDPFSFDGPEIVKCKGCKIDWKEGKDATKKTIKKKQKHKTKSAVRTIVKEVDTDSFFNFFSPPEQLDDEECEEAVQEVLNADFEIGHYIRERIVPRAVLYYTGEALEDEDDEDFEEEDDGEMGEEEEDEME